MKRLQSLYTLGFLLTADPQTAETCFVRGLEDSVEGNAVFKEWARFLGAADDYSECDTSDQTASVGGEVAVQILCPITTLPT